jgi:complement component 1 Q subcomponent-binding protein
MSGLVFGRALQQVTARRVGSLRTLAPRAAMFAPRLLPNRTAAFSTAAGSKVAKVLGAEVKHEEEQYEQSKELKAFLTNSPFKFTENEGDVNMLLERELEDKVVTIEWQLASPFDPNMEDEEGEPEESTNLWVSVESKKSGSGLTFNCSTQTGEDHRYVIGNVKTFASAEEKESVSGYNGPDFEDLDDKLQEAFDEYLAELGMSTEVCDFIDAMALDKEQREYVRWLKTSMEFLEA